MPCKVHEGIGFSAISKCKRREIQGLGDAAAVQGHMHLLVQVGAGHEQDFRIQQGEFCGAVQHGHVAGSEFGPSRSPIPRLALLLVQPFEPHHPAVVWVVAPHVGNLVAVIHARDARHGHQVGHQQAHFGEALVAVVLNVQRPALEFGVLLWVEAAVRKRREARPVLVACDVSHEVMGTVGLQTFSVRLDQILPVAVVKRNGTHHLVVEVEIELGVNHA